MQIQFVMGWSAVFVSAFLFYMATVTIRWSHSSVAIEPAFFTFSRFALGFVIVAISVAVKRRSVRANRFRFLVGRTLGNTSAVFCFYKAVEATTVANANILNMTYPIFVAMIAWFFLREQRDGVALGVVPLAFAGIWLIVAPAGMDWNWNNGWGLASGITASFAIVFLNLSRKHDSAETTLLPAPPEAPHQCIRWSPNGTHIAFVGATAIHVLNMENMNFQTINYPDNLVMTGIRCIEWFSDGG